MFSGFSLMLQSIFRALTKGAQATEKLMSAADRLADVADQTAAGFAEQAAFEREEKLAILRHNMAARTAQLASAGNTTVALPQTAPAP